MSREIFPTGQRRIFREPEESLQRKWSDDAVRKPRGTNKGEQCLSGLHRHCFKIPFSRSPSTPAFSNYFLLFSFFSNRIQKRFLHFLVKRYLTTTGISTDRLAQEGYVLVGYIFVGYSVLRPYQ